MVLPQGRPQVKVVASRFRRTGQERRRHGLPEPDSRQRRSSGATLLAQLISRGQHRFWTDLPAVDPDTLRYAAGHQQVMDAYLVALARTRKGRVVSLDPRLTAHAVIAGDVTIIEP